MILPHTATLKLFLSNGILTNESHLLICSFVIPQSSPPKRYIARSGCLKSLKSSAQSSISIPINLVSLGMFVNNVVIVALTVRI